MRFQTLVAQWQCFDEAAFHAEWRLEQALDEYCLGCGPAPSRVEVAAAKRARFIARHRLRWMLFQTRTARTRAALL